MKQSRWPSGLRRVALVLTTLACGGCEHRSQFVRVDASTFALTHVRVIDGTSPDTREDQTVVIRGGRIASLGPSTNASVDAGTPVLDLSGRSVIPGLIGMHDHLFYQLESSTAPAMVVPAQAAFAKLYLASGVTTIRTAGAVDFDGDRRAKRAIDDGKEPGPHIHLTGPYLNAVGPVPDPAAIASQVETAAANGATSFKAYTSLRLPELQAAIDAAHRLGLRVTGHLCAIGFREAAAAGIDNLEHGLLVDTEFYPKKSPGVCPDQGPVLGDLLNRDITDVEIQQTIETLVQHRVAVTSTLAVFESFAGAVEPRLETLLAASLRNVYREQRERRSVPQGEYQRSFAKLLKKEMEFERAFVAAGGHLMAGVDTTGWGGIVAGFGDQRQLELLVDAGFTPVEAIKIATVNGASFLGEPDLGTIAVGQRADLVVVRGNPSERISDVRSVELVIKDGVGYDPVALIDAAQGMIGPARLPWLLTGRGRLMLTPIVALVIFAGLYCHKRWTSKRALRRTADRAPR